MPHDYSEHFAQVAARYDRLRKEARPDVVEWLGAIGRFEPGQRLVDIGSGTGAATVALAERFELVRAVGVEPSPEMRAQARDGEHVPGRAEELPLPDSVFDRALMQTVVHLLDRGRAFAEARRVLRPGGLLVVSTIDPAGAAGFWLADWFPSFAAIDEGRFPSIETLSAELSAAGFGAIEVHENPRRLSYTRERALTMLRGRFASSFALMDDREYEAGLARAEAELPERFESVLRTVGIVAAAGAH